MCYSKSYYNHKLSISNRIFRFFGVYSVLNNVQNLVSGGDNPSSAGQGFFQ